MHDSTRSSAATRRDFLQRLGVHLAVGTVAATAAPSLLAAEARDYDIDVMPSTVADDFDLTWVKKLTGKHKAVYDSPDIDGGLGVFRSAIVKGQYQAAYKLPSSAVSNVVVLRHGGIALAMNQAFWDAYGVAKANNVKHPWTGESITKNPAMLTPADGLPGVLAGADIHSQLSAGTIMLACNLAFAGMVDMVAKADKLSEEAARTKALSMMIPGILMQPSGVFATTVAQEAGCIYVRAT